MKRQLSPKTRVAVAFAVALLSPTVSHAVSVGLDPADQSTTVGAVVSVDLRFSDLQGEVISAYDLDITYDATVLQATGVQFTSQLGDALLFEVFNASDLSTDGLVDLAQLSLLSDDALLGLQGGDSLVAATLVFQAVGIGTTELDYVFDPFNDVKGRNAAVLRLEPTTAFVTVVAGGVVPEPTAALLFVAGGLLIWPRMRRTN